jgi:hypothetical protein
MSSQLCRPTQPQLVEDLRLKFAEVAHRITTYDYHKGPEGVLRLRCESHLLMDIVFEAGYVHIETIEDRLTALAKQIIQYGGCLKYLEEEWDRVETYLTSGIVEFVLSDGTSRL